MNKKTYTVIGVVLSLVAISIIGYYLLNKVNNGQSSLITKTNITNTGDTLPANLTKFDMTTTTPSVYSSTLDSSTGLVKTGTFSVDISLQTPLTNISNVNIPVYYNPLELKFISISDVNSASVITGIYTGKDNTLPENTYIDGKPVSVINFTSILKRQTTAFNANIYKINFEIVDPNLTEKKVFNLNFDPDNLFISNAKEFSYFFYTDAAGKPTDSPSMKNILVENAPLGISVLPRSLDTDNDGIPDNIEQASNYSDYTKADTDFDGLSDSEEDLNKNGMFEMGETDPRKVDSDNDSIPDNIFSNINKSTIVGNVKCESMPAGKTCADIDTDNDGLTNGQEIKFKNTSGVLEYDLMKIDTNWNSVKDGDEDFDLDGVSNINELKYGLDPLDKYSQAKDGKTLDGDYLVTLSDGKQYKIKDLIQTGIYSNDSSKMDPNADNNHNSIPDLWEITNGLILTETTNVSDKDKDGLSDLDEFQINSDPNNPDSDNDKILDGVEISLKATRDLKVSDADKSVSTILGNKSMDNKIDLTYLDSINPAVKNVKIQIVRKVDIDNSSVILTTPVVQKVRDVTNSGNIITFEKVFPLAALKTTRDNFTDKKFLTLFDLTSGNKIKTLGSNAFAIRVLNADTNEMLYQNNDSALNIDYYYTNSDGDLNGDNQLLSDDIDVLIYGLKNNKYQKNIARDPYFTSQLRNLSTAFGDNTPMSQSFAGTYVNADRDL